MIKKHMTVFMAGTVAWATAASAAMLEDFEPGTSYSGAGTLQADPLDAGNQVLLLAGGEVATFIPTAFEGTVTMKVYDFGEIPTFNGPRWGIADVDESVAVAIIDKPWLLASQGYGMGLEVSQAGDWFSPDYFGGPRQTDLWTTWTFAVAADGSVTISSFASQAYGAVDAMDSIWVSGGKAGNVTQGVLIDDITFLSAADENPLILVDAELQTFEMIVGGTLDAITDMTGDPGTQVDVTLFFTNGVATDGVHIGVPMGGTTAYEGQPWRIDISNTNSFPIFVQQKFVLGDWSWTDGGSSGLWVLSGATNSFSVIVPAGGINTALLMVLANSDWPDTNPVDGVLPTSIQIVGPAPAAKTPIQFYMDWSSGYGLTDTNAAAALDYDVEPDGMDNLLEYALGGNPTTNDAATIQPAATFLDGDTWQYVYKRYRNAADRQLTYDLKTSSDLTGAWASSGSMYETGTNTADAAFDVVTNTITGLANEMFIKLEVTENF